MTIHRIAEDEYWEECDACRGTGRDDDGPLGCCVLCEDGMVRRVVYDYDDTDDCCAYGYDGAIDGP